MVAFWKTDPNTRMNDDPSRKPPPRRGHNFQRPQIYVHVEFGVSWTHGRVPNHHERTYRSKALKERGAYFPRHVPPPNTNYLEPTTVPYSIDDNELQAVYRRQQEEGRSREQPQQREQQHQAPVPRTVVAGSSQHAAQRSRPEREHGRNGSNAQLIDGDDGRLSRDDRSSLHGRGRSAPPPINESPWDVTAQAQAQASYYAADADPATPSAAQFAVAMPMGVPGIQAQGRSVSAGDERLWKQLPQPPTSYRLGEEGMPWDALSWPTGYEPDADPEHTASSYPGQHRMRQPDPGASSTSASNNMAANVTYMPYSPPVANIHVTSPQQTPPPVRRRDLPAGSGIPGEGRDLSALSVAMMTIDNGFENQWWNQGPREHTIVRTMPNTPVAGGGIDPAGGAVATPQDQWFVSPESARVQPRFHDLTAASLGWAVASPPAPRQPQLHLDTHNQRNRASHAASVSTGSIVSPMTPPDYARLGRTLSTRSEEAYLSGGRYA
ncbi:hypothetical protein RB598_003275 [Gaeumannomyces tritici]